MLRFRALMRRPVVWVALLISSGLGVIAINVIEGALGVIVAVALVFLSVYWINAFGPGRDL
jgi:hypothetical protein